MENQNEIMSKLLASLNQQWEEKMQRNEEVRKARLDLEHHRHKMEELVQDLNSSEAWEKELEERRSAVENLCKPALLRYSESLEQLAHGVMVPGSLINELAEGEDWKNVLQVTRNKIMMTDTLNRFETIMLVKMMFTFQDLYLEKDIGDGVARVQELIRKLLIHLGDPGQSWEGLTAREAEVMMYVVKEVNGIPQFVVRLVEALLTKNQAEKRLVMKEMATQTNQGTPTKDLDQGGGTSQ